MKIAVLCAFKNELKEFKKKISGIKIIGKDLFYISNYKNEIFLIETGIGKVNAAVRTSILIREHKIQLIIFSGIAGALDPNLTIGEVFFGENLIQYDFGLINNEKIKIFKPGLEPFDRQKDVNFKINKKYYDLIKINIPEVKPTTIISGDFFIKCMNTKNKLFLKYNAKLVDMESASVAQVASMYNKPLIIFRSISHIKSNTKVLKVNMDLAIKAVTKITLKFLNLLN